MTVEKRTFGSVTEAWEAFDNWLIANWKDGYDSLAPPATDEEIKLLEERLNVTLTDDYKESLKCHNGQNDYSGIFEGNEYLSTEEIYSQWKVWKDLNDDGTFDDNESTPREGTGISTKWYDLGWVPITHDGSGDHYCLDLAPDISKNGKVGQIITMWHDDSDRELLADSFYLFFCKYVNQVLSGETVFSDDYGGLVQKTELVDNERYPR